MTQALRRTVLILAGLLVAVLVGCGTEATPSPTVRPSTPTPQPIAATPTPVPATATPAPTPTPAPSSPAPVLVSPTLASSTAASATPTALPPTPTPLTQTATAVPSTPTPLPSPAQSQVTASIIDYDYQPLNLTIPVGTTVTWVNRGREPHTATHGVSPRKDPNPLWDSGTLNAGQSFSFTFAQPGAFPYFCELHDWMVGVVTVGQSG